MLRTALILMDLTLAAVGLDTDQAMVDEIAQVSFS